MKTHARVRRATSKTPGSVVKARVFFPTPRSAHFVIYVVDKGICMPGTPLECPTVRGSDTSLILLVLPDFCPLFGLDTM